MNQFYSHIIQVVNVRNAHIIYPLSISLSLSLSLSPSPPHKAVGEGERAYQIKVLITKPEDLSLIPETHVMEVED